MLFNHLLSIVDTVSGEFLTKGSYYSIIEKIVQDKPLDFPMCFEFYNRMYGLAMHWSVSQKVSKRTLLFLFSSLYPNNTILVSTLFGLLKEPATQGVSFTSFMTYLHHVYSVLNEVDVADSF